jgi:RNA polymerase sigma-70 factor, ECF subfamily
MVEHLYRAIGTLPELDRTLALLYLDEVSYEEMADVLGISISNVGARLTRLKKRLSEQLKGAAE